MPSLVLPTTNGDLESFELGAPLAIPSSLSPFNRVAYSAAHVVADPWSDSDPWPGPNIDLDATVAYREYLWSLGLAVAEVMDTAQRGMGLDWAGSKTVIEASLGAAKSDPDRIIACGCGTDQLHYDSKTTLDDIVGAYEEQIEFIESLNGQLILMASRALAHVAKSPDDYITVYDRVLKQVSEPVILHWLGDMFDPALSGYWGHTDVDAAMDVCLNVIADNHEKIDGIKISLLDKDKEISMRRRLPDSVRMYTGDDFNYAELIEGDSQGYSHALLGIFDAIAPAAAAALSALADEDTDQFHSILGPTVPLSRHIFKAPTRFYKTGVVFLAYLNGHQKHFCLLGGQQSARSMLHLVELFRLADAAGLIHDPDTASARMRSVLSTYGVES